MQSKFPDITAVILAGGQARRMDGEDKGLIKVSGKAMIEYVISALQTQLDKILINANRNQHIYTDYGFPVISDNYEGFAGPLAGMASSMKIIETKYMISVPCDSPLLANDYVTRMFNILVEKQADIAVADNGERIQPVFCLLKCSLLESLESYLRSGERKIDRWFKQHQMTHVDFSDNQDMFINVNAPDDIKIIENRLMS